MGYDRPLPHFFARACARVSLIASLVLGAAAPAFSAKTPEELVTDLKSSVAAVRAEARQALVSAGADCVKPIVGFADNARRRSIAQGVLLEVGAKKSVPALIALLGDPELAGRAGSLLFSVIGRESADQAPRLIECVGNRPQVANYCGTALVKSMSPGAKGQVSRLVSALSDGDPLVRLYAAAALSRIGKAAKSAVSALQKAQGDSSEEVRRQAQEALKSIHG